MKLLKVWKVPYTYVYILVSLQLTFIFQLQPVSNYFL